MELIKYPDLTFATADIDEMTANAKIIVESLLQRTLERADPLMLFVKSLLTIIAQQRLKIDEAAKQNLLVYATGANLEHLGALVGVERLQPAPATTTLEIRLSTPRQKATAIRKGTRVTAGDSVNFATDEDVIIVAGDVSATVTATCTVDGDFGNGYGVGEINQIVDPQPFLAAISNLTISDGGSDLETDDSLRDRIHQAPESFSVAGPEGAYIFWAKTANPNITDVFVTSEAAGEVDVYPLMKGGNLPNQEVINEVHAVINAKKIRPLTDKVIVKAPHVRSYDIDARYWIARSNATSAANIQLAADNAVEDYIAWQRAKLGRDVSDTELNYFLRRAGVKRVEIYAPKFVTVPNDGVAIPNNVNVVCAGLEDD